MIRTPEQICKILETLKSERSTWEPHWQEIGDYIIPRKNDINNFKAPGQKRNLQLFDNTGMTSNEILAGMLHGMLLNPATIFFELSTGDQTLDQKAEVRMWLQDTVLRMHAAMNNTNFQTEAHEFLLDLCSLNTASMSVLEDTEKDLFFQSHFLKELYIQENYRGMVTEQYLVKHCSARNLVEEFGMKNVPDAVKHAFESGKAEDKFETVQATYPADAYGEKKKGFKWPIVSQHIFVKDKFQMKLSGFNEMPWSCSRWSKASGEKYGRGPGMNALPEVKMVNLMEEVSIKGAQLAIAPPVQMPDDGFGQLKAKPYGVNYYRAGSKDRIETIFGDTRLDYSIQIMDSHRQRIKEAFYVDQLQTPQVDRATATEISQRSQEQGRFLGPLLARLEVEWLSPTVDRVFGILMRRKRFLDPPDILGGRPLQVKFSSAIAKIQRAGEIRNVMEFLTSLAPIAQVDQKVLHYLNGDATLKGLAAMYSYPQKFLHNDDEVKKIRDAEAQAQQEVAQQQQEQHEAEVANKVAPAAMAAQKMQEPVGV